MKTIRRTYPILFIGTFFCLLPAFASFGAESTVNDGSDAGKEASCYDTGNSAVLVCGSKTADTERIDLTSGGPGARDAAQASDTGTDTDKETGTKGESLGMFTTTGYCTCTQCCSSGWTLTYSGTVPKANHTISADISLYPIGTKLMIDDVIYTVEDVGSSVADNWIDIYYDNHDAAVAHGMKQQEVFTVLP